MVSLKIFRIIIQVSFVFIITFVLFSPNEEEFHDETALYTYSAIFQGFAAILAISITIALVSRQSLSNQIYNIEERIFKIIGTSVPEYRPISLMNLEFYVREKFPEDFRKELKKRPQETLSEDLVIGISDELRRMFLFIGKLSDNDKLVRETFTASLVLSVIVLIFSLTALVYVTPENNTIEYLSFADFQINTNTILYLVFFVTAYSLIYLAHFFYGVMKAWVIRYSQRPIAIFQ